MSTLTAKAVEKKLVTLRGNMAAVARAFGVTRQAVAKFVASRPGLLAVVKDCRESMIDTAESSLYRAVTYGEAWAVCFFLKCQAKHRGYVERTELLSDNTQRLIVTEEITDASSDGPKDDPAPPGPGGVPPK